MPDLAKYQGHVNAIYAALRVAEKQAATIMDYDMRQSLGALHTALKAGADDLIADNPGLVQPDDGDPKT